MNKWNKPKIIEKLLDLEKSLKRKPKKRDDAYLYFLSRKYFGSWNNMMKSAGYNVKFTQRPEIPDLNSDLLFYFLGLLSTDGHIAFGGKCKNYRIILFTSNEKELIIKLIKKLFNYKASIRKRQLGFAKRINYEVYISSKELCKFFINKLGIPYGAKSLTIRIPKFINNAQENKIWSFIRGVIDGDGSIIKTKKSSSLKIPSGSKEFIFDMNKLLIKLGFNSGKIRQEKENMWILRINKKEDIKRMYPLIYKKCGPFYYVKKKKVWEQYI